MPFHMFDGHYQPVETQTDIIQLKSVQNMMNASHQNSSNGHKCNSKNGELGCKGNASLQPMHLSSFNLREIVKQMVLLEDHLFTPSKRCQECIAKHFLTIEAFADEGVTLEGNASLHKVLRAISMYVRHLHDNYRKVLGHDTSIINIASNIRVVRKFLMKEGKLY